LDDVELSDMEGSFDAEKHAEKKSMRVANARAQFEKNVKHYAPPPTNEFAAVNADAVAERAAVDAMIDHATRCPIKASLYWICRSQDEFDWFAALLEKCMDGPCQDMFEINLFCTRDLDRSKFNINVKNVFTGRPNWGALYQDVKDEVAQSFPGINSVGVFLCGPPLIGKQLRTTARRMSDDKLKFDVFTESF